MNLLKLRVLVIGSGGREDALAWKIKNSPGFSVEVFVAPGNSGRATGIALTPYKEPAMAY